jgi:mannose-6-phosphate isomerase-like protein (cupin superfamily)
MRPHAEARIARLSESETVSFGPLAHYNKLTGDDGLPIFTGVQTCKPGYQTPLHWHPYVECLFIIEGAMDAWLEGQEDRPARLEVGDMIALPACVPHVFRNAGEGQRSLPPPSHPLIAETRLRRPPRQSHVVHVRTFQTAPAKTPASARSAD